MDCSVLPGWQVYCGAVVTWDRAWLCFMVRLEVWQVTPGRRSQLARPCPASHSSSAVTHCSRRPANSTLVRAASTEQSEPAGPWNSPVLSRHTTYNQSYVTTEIDIIICCC